MSTTLIIIAVSILLILNFIGNVRQSIKFDEMYRKIQTLVEKSDEKVLEYSQYVVEQLKENKTVLTYSTWAS